MPNNSTINVIPKIIPILYIRINIKLINLKNTINHARPMEKRAYKRGGK